MRLVPKVRRPAAWTGQGRCSHFPFTFLISCQLLSTVAVAGKEHHDHIALESEALVGMGKATRPPRRSHAASFGAALVRNFATVFNQWL